MVPTRTEVELAALGRWRQGHLVHAAKTPWVSLPTSHVSSQVSGEAGDSQRVVAPAVTSTEVRITVDPGEGGAVPFVVVISQTCDVVGEGPGARHPFVQVAPLRDVSDWPPDRLGQLRRGELNGLIYLTAPPEPDAHWALDLRMTWPLAKEVLIARAPVDGFASFEDERQIGVHLSIKFQRPALPNILSKTLPDEIRACVVAGLKRGDWVEEILQVRLEVLGGTQLAPEDVRMVVVSDAPLRVDQKKPLTNLWKGFRRRLKEDGIEWANPSFRTLDNLSARVYRDSIMLNIPELRSGSANRP